MNPSRQTYRSNGTSAGWTNPGMQSNGTCAHAHQGPSTSRSNGQHGTSGPSAQRLNGPDDVGTITFRLSPTYKTTNDTYLDPSTRPMTTTGSPPPHPIPILGTVQFPHVAPRQFLGMRDTQFNSFGPGAWYNFASVRVEIEMHDPADKGQLMCLWTKTNELVAFFERELEKFENVAISRAKWVLFKKFEVVLKDKNGGGGGWVRGDGAPACTFMSSRAPFESDDSIWGPYLGMGRLRSVWDPPLDIAQGGPRFRHEVESAAADYEIILLPFASLRRACVAEVRVDGLSGNDPEPSAFDCGPEKIEARLMRPVHSEDGETYTHRESMDYMTALMSLELERCLSKTAMLLRLQQVSCIADNCTPFGLMNTQRMTAILQRSSPPIDTGMISLFSRYPELEHLLTRHLVRLHACALVLNPSSSFLSQLSTAMKMNGTVVTPHVLCMMGEYAISHSKDMCHKQCRCTSRPAFQWQQPEEWKCKSTPTFVQSAEEFTICEDTESEGWYAYFVDSLPPLRELGDLVLALQTCEQLWSVEAVRLKLKALGIVRRIIINPQSTLRTPVAIPNTCPATTSLRTSPPSNRSIAVRVDDTPSNSFSSIPGAYTPPTGSEQHESVPSFQVEERIVSRPVAGSSASPTIAPQAEDSKRKAMKVRDASLRTMELGLRDPPAIESEELGVEVSYSEPRRRRQRIPLEQGVATTTRVRDVHMELRREEDIEIEGCD